MILPCCQHHDAAAARHDDTFLSAPRFVAHDVAISPLALRLRHAMLLMHAASRFATLHDSAYGALP